MGREAVSKVIRTVRLGGSVVTLGEAERELNEEIEEQSLDSIGYGQLIESQVEQVRKELEAEWEAKLRQEMEYLQAEADKSMREAETRFGEDRAQVHQQRYDEGYQAGLDQREAEAAEAVLRMGVLHDSNMEIKVHPDDLQIARRFAAHWIEKVDQDAVLNLHELSETISSSFDIEDILASLMDLSGRFVAYESCGVFALDGERDSLETLIVRGAPGLEERLAAQWEDGIIDWVLREHRPVVIEDMETVDQRDAEEHCTVVVPLIVRGAQIGIFALYCQRTKDEFTSGELELLGVLASQAAIALENSRLYNDLEETHTQLKDSQQRIMFSTKFVAIGELAGGGAHEVNNPLQIILSRVQLMILQNKDEPRVVKGLRLIEHNVKRISRIISALLGFAGHNAQEAEWEEYDLEPALRQALALVEHQLDKGLIETTLDCEEDLPQLTGNVGELEQVFINLMINAQNAMAEGGALKIEARREGSQIELRFADTGPGIAPEHLDRIFEPFYTTRGDEGGTGLGLAVSYRIIKRHQGMRTVASEPGRGATFIIRLPLAGVEGKEEAYPPHGSIPWAFPGRLGRPPR